MTTRFVVLDHGLTTSVYKIHANQTARLKNEFGNEGIELFDDLEQAKQAALAILGRLEEVSKEANRRSFSFQSDNPFDSLKTALTALTEDRVDTFFV